MSTRGARHQAAVAVTRFAWQPSASPPSPSTVRPLMTADPGGSAQRQRTHDLILPSVIAQRAASAEREGYDRGFAAGEQAGHEASRVRGDATLARLAATIEGVASLRTAMLHRSEQDLVRLAIAIAERILRREVRANRHLLVNMATAAARKLGESCVISILLHPDDYSAVASARAPGSNDGPIRLVADAGILPGGCQVQSGSGTIDVGVDAQIRELLRGFFGEDADQGGPSGSGEAGGHD